MGTANVQTGANSDFTRDDRPLVFFMPAAGGKHEAYTRFCNAVGNGVRFVVLDYPDWTDMIGKGAGFNVIIDAAVQQILGMSVGPSYFLAGYSYGGFVAWEVAYRLRQLGKRIGFIGLVDARRQIDVREPETRGQWVRRKLSELYATPRRALANARWELLYPIAMRRCPRPLLRAVGELAQRSTLTSGFADRLLLRTRLAAANSWSPKPLEVPAYLFRSDEFSRGAADFHWGPLCPQLRVVPVTGSHLTLFDPENLETLGKAFSEAVQTAARLPRSTEPQN